MRTRLRSLTLGLAASLGLTALAQTPYVVTVAGDIAPCPPVLPGTQVMISTGPGVTPQQSVPATLTASCHFEVIFDVNEPSGTFTVNGSCGNGQAFTQTDDYFIQGPSGTTDVVFFVDCGTTPSCEACFTVAQNMTGNEPTPFTADFTNCSTGGTGPYAYLWDFTGGTATSQNMTHTFPGPGTYGVCLNLIDANGILCDNICQSIVVDENGNINPANVTCDPCFTVAQSSGGGALTPFSADFTNCSTGVLPVYTYTWDFGDGSTGQGEDVTHVFAAPGAYYVCLIIIDPNGLLCSTLCQDVIVDENGTIDPPTDPCEAGFWAMQAYDGDPNSGTGTPIPYELWIWNLSSGGTGLFQFVWDFGDGTSSTEAFPTHTYSGTGPYELCLTIVDSEGCEDEYCDSISVDEDGMLNGMTGGGDDRSTLTINVRQPLSTGVTEHSFTELSVWPNPVSDELNIGLASGMAGNVPVTVFDANGREVISITRPVMDGKNRFTLPTSELVPGMYLLRIGSGGDIAVHRFAKTY